MFFTQKTYDLDFLAKSNLHIHTSFSNCAKQEMTIENIIRMAEYSGLEMIALCDHIYRPEELPEFINNCNILKEKRDKYNSEVKILIGGEFSCYGVDEYTLKGIEFQTEYRLYSQNHYHVTGWQQADEMTPEAYKELTKLMLQPLFEARAADTIAHPLSGAYLRKITGWDTDTLGKCWTDNEIGDIMTKAYENECAWELNTSSILSDPSLGKRMYHIGKEIGIVFTLGTDAHRLTDVNPQNIINKIKSVI